MLRLIRCFFRSLLYLWQMKKLRLVFADDHPLILMGMQDFFANDLRFDIVGTATSSTQLVALIENTAPDVIITDYSMPGDAKYGDGLQLMSFLTRKYPKTKLLVVTMMSNPLILESLYKAGAVGVVLKSEDLSSLEKALESIYLGRRYTQNDPSQQVQRTPHTNREQNSTLSPKEIEVIRRFVEGMSPTEIAHELKRSIKTISNQKRTAMGKLRVNSDQELVAFCTENHFF